MFVLGVGFGVLLCALPALLLLKQKDVLFAIAVVLIVVEFVAGYRPGDIAVAGGAGVVVLIVAAIRLAPPGSVWARWAYDAPKRERARARITPQSPPVEPVASGAEPGIPPPVTVAVVVVAIGAMATALGSVFGLLVAGAMLSVLWLVRRGWRRGRVLAGAGAGALLVGLVVSLALPPLTNGEVIGIVGLVVLAAGLVLLWRKPVTRHLRDLP